MPSGSFKNFKLFHMKDIEKIISNYETVNDLLKGRRSLDHLMRSGVLLLAGAWENYIEEVLYESAYFACGNLDPEYMPVPVKKNISKNIVRDYKKNGIAPFEKLTDHYWTDYYLDLVWDDIENLNTPKEEQINHLFHVHLGVDEMTSNYRIQGLDNFITLRGQIAHRMRTGEYLKLQSLKEHIIFINHLVYDTDYYLYTYLKGLVGKTPWNNTY